MFSGLRDVTFAKEAVVRLKNARSSPRFILPRFLSCDMAPGLNA
jgi:hypothetical protein